MGNALSQGVVISVKYAAEGLTWSEVRHSRPGNCP